MAYGHINFDHAMGLPDRKGITENVTINGKV